MSKSLKNFISIHDYLHSDLGALVESLGGEKEKQEKQGTKGASSQLPSSAHARAVDFRIFCLQHKYHSALHFGLDRIRDAGNVREKLSTFFRRTQHVATLAAADTNTNTSTNTSVCAVKPTNESRKLTRRVQETKDAVHLAFCDDFDTPTALAAITDLVGHAIQYAASVSVGGEGGEKEQPVQPLLEAEEYVRGVLSLLGVQIENQKDLGADSALSMKSEDDSSHSSNSSGRGQSGQSAATIDALVEFRTEVRASALSELKALKKEKKEQEKAEKEAEKEKEKGSSGVISGGQPVESTGVEKREERMAHLQQVLACCDLIRNEMGPRMGVTIEDVGESSIWTRDA